MVKSLLECDSVGNVLIKQLTEYQTGERLKPPKVDISDNILTATAEIDSMSIYLSLKDRYVERAETSKIMEMKEVEVNRLNGWQKFRLWIGNIALILIPVGIYFKIKKIKL